MAGILTLMTMMTLKIIEVVVVAAAAAVVVVVVVVVIVVVVCTFLSRHKVVTSEARQNKLGHVSSYVEPGGSGNTNINKIQLKFKTNCSLSVC